MPPALARGLPVLPVDGGSLRFQVYVALVKIEKSIFLRVDLSMRFMPKPRQVQQAKEGWCAKELATNKINTEAKTDEVEELKKKL